MIHIELVPQFRVCQAKQGNGKPCNGIQELEDKIYRFGNTKKPYALRHCDKADHHSLVLLKED